MDMNKKHAKKIRAETSLVAPIENIVSDGVENLTLSTGTSISPLPTTTSNQEEIISFSDTAHVSTAAKPQAKIQFDRIFDQIGLWILTLTLSFLLSGFIFPLFFLASAATTAYPSFVLILGAISSLSSAASVFAWFIVSKFGIAGAMRITISLWVPAFLSQQLKMIPASMMTPSKSIEDYIFYVLVCLVLPSLLGSSFGLIGLYCQFRFFGQIKEKED